MPAGRAASRSSPLAAYWAKRDFAVTSEPRGEQGATGEALSFVIQKHAATRLHYDFRLELDGVLLSWAVPKGPSIDPADKRMANRVGKLFVDYLRNGHGAATTAALPAQARPGLGVSMPVAWDDLPRLKSGAQWAIATAREYLSFQTEDPWAGYWKKRQTLAAAMRVLWPGGRK